MCRRTLFLIFLILVLGGASHTWAGQEPVAHYDFEGINDFSNTGTNTAAITGEPKGNAQIIWDDDRGSYVLSLDGDGDYINCGNEGIGHIGTTITVAAWIKTDSLASGGRAVAKGYAWSLRAGGNGTFRFEVSGTQPSGSRADGSTNVNDGRWHHVAGTYDGTEYKLYVDGRLNGSMDATGPINTWDGYWFCIGAHYKKDDIRDPRDFFNGLIDDVRLYDRVLSEEEILEITAIVAVKAAAPSPADGLQLDVVQGVVLSWIPGTSADKHYVYFGTNFDDVNEASPTIDPNNVYKGRQDPNQYAVGATLDFGRTYYWRIDEVEADGTTIHKGSLWQFTAEPFGYPIPGSTVTATADSNDTGKGPENTTNGSGLDNALHSKETADMWLSGSEPNAWIEYELDKVYKLHEMQVWNYNGESILAGYGIKNATIEYSTDGIAYTTLGATHEFAQAPGADGYAHDTAIDFEGAAAKYVRITANSNWGGALYDRYGLSEINFYYIPVWAREPNPADGATGVGPNVVLGFRAGREAATHDVYLGTNRETVLDGTAYASPVTEASYDAGALDLGKTYYWRVDEVNEAQTPTTWQGDIWNFATPDYLILDNFEDYNDYEPHEMWRTWVDGYDNPAINGAMAGNAEPPFAETTIVHGGEQSMPLFYENNFKYSEAKWTLSPPQDWTKNGVKALLINFYGDPDNTVEQMYVKLNGSKVVYDGDAADIAKPLWNRWSIDLASFDVNLADVTTLAIGFGDETNLTPGGSGVVYFDDIRLYRLVPEPPVEIWLEAEAADSITLPMKTYDSQLASGGQYIGTDAGSGDAKTDPPIYGVATYNFTVPEGTYKVLLHVIVIGGDDSFWVRIPGAAYAPGTHSSGWIKFNAIDKGDDWHWDEVHSSSHGNEVVKFTLSAGEHTLEIAYRDAGTLLDCILITDELDLDQRSLPHVVP